MLCATYLWLIYYVVRFSSRKWNVNNLHHSFCYLRQTVKRTSFTGWNQSGKNRFCLFLGKEKHCTHFEQRVKGCILSNTFWEESQLERGGEKKKTLNCSLSGGCREALRHRSSWKTEDWRTEAIQCQAEHISSSLLRKSWSFCIIQRCFLCGSRIIIIKKWIRVFTLQMACHRFYVCLQMENINHIGIKRNQCYLRGRSASSSVRSGEDWTLIDNDNSLLRWYDQFEGGRSSKCGRQQSLKWAHSKTNEPGRNAKIHANSSKLV